MTPNRKRQMASIQSIPGTHPAVEAVDDLFYVFDAELSLVDWNERVSEVTGYDETELPLMEPTEFIPEQYHESIANAVSDVLNGQRAEIEAALLAKNGDTIPYEFTASPLYDEGGDVVGFAGIGRDISTQKQHREDLQRATEFLRQAQEAADIGSWEVDFRTDTLRWSDQTFRIHGLEPGDEPGISEAFEFYHPDDQGEIRDAFDRLRTDAVPFDVELRIITADGETKWVRAQGRPWETDDALAGARGTFQDITEQVRNRKRLQRQRDDLETLSEMLQHDLRNTLQVVTAHAEVLIDRVDSGLKAHTQTIHENVESAVDLIETAEELSRTMCEEEQPVKPLSIRETLTAQIEQLRSMPSTGSVTVAGTIPEVPVKADEMLPSVFRNLLTNAVLHNDKETPEITISAERQDEEVAVAIADNGPGIADERKDDIFGKGEQGLESDGTGIGLYLVNTLVSRYGGTVTVEDNEPNGAVFTVTLPIAHGPET